MNKKITINELFEIIALLKKAIANNRKNFKWNYCLNKNTAIVNNEIKTIQETIDKDATPEQLEEMGKQEIEVNFFAFNDKMFDDADVSETNLYLDYFNYEPINTENHG